jgi:hypothetical protein
MAYELTNALRSTSILRVVDGSADIPISDLAVNENEVVISASIKRVVWSTNGSITIVRNSQPILTLYDSGDMRLSEMGHSIANNATSNVEVTITSNGSAILEISKQATYTTALEGI